MLIVVEGPDGAGKSTLVKKISGAVTSGRPPCARRTGEPYARLINGMVYGDTQVLHRGPPERHPLEEYVLDLDGYDPRHTDHVVCDRWHLGEPIYSAIYRPDEGSKLGTPGLRYVDMYLASRGGVTAVVNADPVTLTDRVNVRGDDYVNPDDLERISHAYAEDMVGHYDMYFDTTADRDPKVNRLVKLARVNQALAADPFTVTDRWIGSPRPDVLLVGDVTSPRHLRGERPSYRTPFIPYRDSSGYALLDALPEDFWYCAAIANHAEVPLIDLWDALGEPHVVALGGNASRACRDLFDSGYAAVPHPQYVRRFFNDQLPKYGELIAARAGSDDKETPAWLSR